ncbi:intradiol ring-cleavage dioxygenase [Agitococcus lubricus]|uniref:Dioxygenase-like protein n=1 Tax=Agitococcus lubricus TaxID=1077255 RepID=A0A2T5J460_9GAMM|nr:intradiol ring-cleavage dioxygenase [Agitococcus lubricus]PTQ91391.1 dioxygenase-like protein [Agitococcus lubricus]
MTTPISQHRGFNRRQLLGGLSALTALSVIGCNSGGDNSSNNTSSQNNSATNNTTSETTTDTLNGNCVIIPTETIGPYPLLAFLSNSAVRRQDIRDDRTGVLLTVKLKIVNVNDSCRPLANTAVYIWHCDKDGAYSGYSSGQNGNHANESFLRGVQVSDDNGEVTFTTIYPGWYAGRITHIHFQVYLANNLNVSAIATSQMAFPQAISQAVYNSSLYSSHGQNSSVSSFSADNVFSDGVSYQMTTVTGDVNTGYIASLTAGIAA